jgi:hypothetical protein
MRHEKRYKIPMKLKGTCQSPKPYTEDANLEKIKNNKKNELLEIKK